MFVRYFLELPLAAARVERALRHPPPAWLSAMAGAAEQRGDELLTEVGVGPLGSRLGLEELLPRLDANLELGSLGEDRTQLAISARYRPPLGVVGRAVDRVLLHRVAEATLKDFLDQVGQAIVLSQSGGAATMGS
jgi:hypothetical protein